LKSPQASLSVELGKALRSGAFSNAFEIVNTDNNGKNVGDMFIKVPKSYQMMSLATAARRALKDLTENIHVPKLFGTNDPLKTMSIQIRCEMSVSLLA
jgi:hypothetical protein